MISNPAAGCTCILIDVLGSPACAEPVVAQVVMGCEHEHLDESDAFCDLHLQMARDGVLRCTVCWPRRVTSYLLAEVRGGEVVRVLNSGPLIGS